MSLKHIEEKDFEEMVVKNNKLVLVDFFATWCGPCRMLTPELEKVAESVQEYADVVKIDVDENRNLAKQFGVMSIPTLVVMKNGAEVERVIGFRQSADLIQLLAFFR